MKDADYCKQLDRQEIVNLEAQEKRLELELNKTRTGIVLLKYTLGNIPDFEYEPEIKRLNQQRVELRAAIEQQR